MKKIIAVLLPLLIIFSCRTTLVPPYDAEVVKQLSTAAKASDLLFLSAAAASADKRTYASFADKYIAVQTELIDLQRREQARIKNPELVHISNDILTLFIKYKDRHKDEDAAIAPGVLDSEREEMDAKFNALLVAEHSLK